MEDYGALKKRVDQLRRDRDLAQGRLDELLRRLREEHGVDSTKAAEALLKALRDKQSKVEARYKGELEKFKAKWGSLLEGNSGRDP